MNAALLFWDGGLRLPGIYEAVWGLASVILTVGFWAVLIYLIAKVARTQRSQPSSAVALLEERYARGEISREEFLERKSVLQGRSTPPPAHGSEGST